MHNNTCLAIAACCCVKVQTAIQPMCGCIMHQLLCYDGTGAILSKGSQLRYRISPLLCAIPLTRTFRQICCRHHWKLLMTLQPLAVTPFTLGPQPPQQQLRVQLCCSCKLSPNKQTSLHPELLLTVRTSQYLQLARLQQQCLMISSQMYRLAQHYQGCLAQHYQGCHLLLSMLTA